MKRTTLNVGLALVCGAGLMTGCAQEKDAGIGSVGMVGMWSGESNVVTAKHGFAKGQRTITIKDQQGTEFTGENTWATKVDGKPVRATEKLVGTYDPATGCVFMAESEDTGVIMGRLVDKDTLEIVYVEAGADATVFKCVLRRQGTAARER